MRIRVTTRADLFEQRKREHLKRGYRIEDERPVPVNGFCSFVAVERSSKQGLLEERVAQALKGNHRFREDW